MSRLGDRTVRLCALMLLFALVMAPTAAWAKDFSIDSIGIGAAVDANGDLRVTEERAVDFNGQFSWAEWKLNTEGSDGIEILGVSSVNGDTEQQYTKVDGEATVTRHLLRRRQRGLGRGAARLLGAGRDDAVPHQLRGPRGGETLLRHLRALLAVHRRRDVGAGRARAASTSRRRRR